MEIIIYSRILNHLNLDLAKTSSEIFEIEFAKTLSRTSEVSIVSYKAKKYIKEDNLRLYPLNERESLDIAIDSVIKKNNIYTDEKRIMIMYGYDIRILFPLKKLTKKYNCKLISFTFDSHLGAIADKKFIRRILIDFYFKIGIKFLNQLDGIILFNKDAYKEMKLKIPYIISRVGINEDSILNNVYNRKRKENFNIVYAGSLIEYNSINILIDSVKCLNEYKVYLDIYGDGPLKKTVIDASEKYSNIDYHGLVDNKEISKAIESADLLINLRDTQNYISKFAFPSKLIQYMASGVPVLSTKVLDDIEFEQAAFVINNLDPKKIREIIVYIIEHPIEQTQKSEYAKEYIRTNFLWSDIVRDINYFLNDISRDIGRVKEK